ncbi:MAG TPA: hypothetical protein VJL60_03050 [Gammaproteobacteria bacterium]|nr:hypothetical protein [Gammaproteobacteria bacterium]
MTKDELKNALLKIIDDNRETFDDSLMILAMPLRAQIEIKLK